MPSERIQRRIDRLLDQAEAAADSTDWSKVIEFVAGVLALDAENEDALAFREMADKASAAGSGDQQLSDLSYGSTTPEIAVAAEDGPTSFVNGRYKVTGFLGEGGKKRVYMAHDTTLDRGIAFALIKTEGLDEIGRERMVLSELSVRSENFPT